MKKTLRTCESTKKNCKTSGCRGVEMNAVPKRRQAEEDGGAAGISYSASVASTPGRRWRRVWRGQRAVVVGRGKRAGSGFLAGDLLFVSLRATSSPALSQQPSLAFMTNQQRSSRSLDQQVG